MKALACEYPVRAICRTIGTIGPAPSSFYYRCERQEEAGLRDALVRLAGEWPRYGRPRLTQMLQREGWSVGERRVGRLMQQLGLAAKRPARKPRTTQSAHAFPRWPNQLEGLAVLRPDQVWVGDITYIRLREEFVYLAVLMDVFTRAIRGWNLSRNLDAALSGRALEQALLRHTPEIHHSDQGVQYACAEYVGRLESVGCRISMAPVGCPEENGYAERLMRTIKEEHVELTECWDFADAQEQIGHFLEQVYQSKRIHSSLGYLTPTEFEADWRNQQVDHKLA